MSVIPVTSLNLKDVKENSILYSPVLVEYVDDKTNEKIITVDFDVVQFKEWSKVLTTDKEIEANDHNKHFAKVIELGSLEFDEIFDETKLQKLIKESIEVQKEKQKTEDSIIKYRSLEYGMFTNPKDGFKSLLEKIAQMKDALNKLNVKIEEEKQ